MLEFIIGRAGSGKTEICLQALQKKMVDDPMGPALILLLPEHMTYRMERTLAGRMQETGRGFVRSYVFGFRRFARQILLETGGAAYPRITEIGRQLLLRKSLEQRGTDLQVFQRAAKQRGFTASLAAAIEEFKSYGISAAALQQAANQMEPGRLQGKLQDLSLLFSDFAAGMQGRYNDAEDLLDLLAKKIPAADLLSGAEIWVDGFAFFNPQEKNILRALLTRGIPIHLTLEMDTAPDARENRSEAGVFHRSYETFQELRRMAEDLGISYHRQLAKGQYRYRAGALQVLEQGLFHFPLRPHKEQDGLRLVETPNRRMEVEAVAADILRLCREEGYRWREIGILVRDQEAYDGLLELVLEDYQIPFFQDRKRKSLHHPLAELVRSSFEVLRGWRYEAVFRCIKTDFFPLTREQADRLENYVLQFGIRGKRWLMEADWGYEPEELRGAAAEKIQQELAEINLLRRRITALVQPFSQAVKKAKNVRDYTTALYEFLLALKVPETLEEWTIAAEKAGALVEAREHAQIWADLMEMLDQFMETSGEEMLPARGYEALLEEGLDGLQLSLIPPGMDYVTVASFDQNSLENLRALYIVGANEGSMPRRSRDQGLLSDADRLYLMEAGVELSSSSVKESFMENYRLYRAFTLGRDYLWVSYALADSEGHGLGKSSLFERVEKLLPYVRKISIPLESLDLMGEGRLDWLGAKRQAGSLLAGALRAYRENRSVNPLWQDLYNWFLENKDMDQLLTMVTKGFFARMKEDCLPAELAQQLYTKHRRLRGSVTRFENFRACPFRHFAQYGLKLRERKLYEFRAPDLGTLLHAALKDFGETLQTQNRRWQSVDGDECHALCEQIVNQLAPKLQNEILLSTAQYQNLLQRIRQTAERAILRLIAFDRVSRFSPVAFERSFGLGTAGMPPLLYELPSGIVLEITGQIDRIDRDETGKYFLVMDYKTGQAYINLIEVYYGLRLQLLTYLLVAQNMLSQEAGKPVLPAGMLYCFLKNPLLTEEKRLSSGEAKEALAKKMRMPGWVLADPEVIRSIDDSLKFIKVSLKNDGSIYQASRSNVKTPEEFQILLDYIAYMLTDTGQAILSGEIAPRPYQLKGRDACSYCAYRAVCGFDLQLPGAAYRQLSAHGEEELIDTMEWIGKEHPQHALVKSTAESH